MDEENDIPFEPGEHETESEFVRKSLSLKPEQVDFLNEIDSENISKASRSIIDRAMKDTKFVFFQKYLLTFAMGIVLFAIGSFLENLFTSLTCMITGVFMIGFSVYMYIIGRIKYNRGDKY